MPCMPAQAIVKVDCDGGGVMVDVCLMRSEDVGLLYMLCIIFVVCC